MAQPAIKVEGLSKRYHIGGRRSYDTLRDKIMDAVTSPIRSLRRFGRSSHREEDTIWALKDVSFEVEPGEVVGIIGRNGAGKSTLLKILTRITEPTSGRAELLGRVASLLEVGTGFHHELSGRENIFLSGAILGMTRQETRARFDEIVDFAGVEKFIDTPVKRYSSGMRVRLGFAVAAHLQPEILLVDEVLAIGDAEFQKKCLGKMGDVAKGGRTVLVVSHNMGTIRGLAERSVWLDRGRAMFIGSSDAAIAQYLNSGADAGTGSVSLVDHPNRLGGTEQILTDVCCKRPDGAICQEFHQSEPIVLELAYDAGNGAALAGAGITLCTDIGVRVGGFNTYMGMPPPHRLPSKGVVRFVIDPKQLTPGRYRVTVSVGSHQTQVVDKVENAISFSILPDDIYGTGYLLTREDGVLAMKCRTEVGPK